MMSMVVPAHADTPGGLRDLIGARGSSVDSEMPRRGYTLAKSNDIAEYWWNGSRKSCASVVVDDGRVQEINTETAKQCGKSGGGDGAAAAVVGALLVGAIIAGAASSDKHKHRDDDDDYRGGYDYSPARGVTCYPRESACYDEGDFSSYWTRREF